VKAASLRRNRLRGARRTIGRLCSTARLGGHAVNPSLEARTRLSCLVTVRPATSGTQPPSRITFAVGRDASLLLRGDPRDDLRVMAFARVVLTHVSRRSQRAAPGREHRSSSCAVTVLGRVPKTQTFSRAHRGTVGATRRRADGQGAFIEPRWWGRRGTPAALARRLGRAVLGMVWQGLDYLGCKA